MVCRVSVWSVVNTVAIGYVPRRVVTLHQHQICRSRADENILVLDHVAYTVLYI